MFGIFIISASVLSVQLAQNTITGLKFDFKLILNCSMILLILAFSDGFVSHFPNYYSWWVRIDYYFMTHDYFPYNTPLIYVRSFRSNDTFFTIVIIIISHWWACKIIRVGFTLSSVMPILFTFI